MGHLAHLGHLSHLPHLMRRRAAPAPTFAQLMAASAPVLWWRLNETSGTVAADASGNGRVGTYTDVTMSQAGAVKNDADFSVRFNGTSSVVTSAAYVFTSSLVTMSMWYRPDALGVAQEIAICRNGATYDKQVQINADGTVSFFVFDGGAKTTTTATALVVGLWYRIVCVCDGTNALIYLNGVQDGTPTPASGSYTGYGSPNVQLGFGRFFYGSGWLDEFAMYDRAMTAGEVAAMYAAGAKTAVTVASATIQLTPTVAAFAFSVPVAGGTMPPTGLTQIEVDYGAGYVDSDAGTIAGDLADISLTFADTLTAGDPWRILSDIPTTQLDFGADKYLKVPAAGVLA